MEHLTIDRDLCIRCGRCIADCPMGIPCTDEHGNYCSNEENAEVCIYCGHCVAVCPTGAITLNPMEDKEQLQLMENYGIVPLGLSQKECRPSETEKQPCSEQLEALIRSRRMTRSFKNELVSKSVVEHIVNDVLAYAPSGHNSRGYEAVVVEGREKLEKLTVLSLEYFEKLIQDGGLHAFDVKVFQRMIQAWKEGKDRVFRTAPEAIIIHCSTSIVPADPAVKVMLTYFEILANGMGIGTVWAGYFMVAANYLPIKKMLGIPEDHTVYGAMMFGYPEFTYKYIPKRPGIGLKFM